MFQVQPIRDRKLQEDISSLLGCPFFEDTYAFFAGEMAEDYRTVTSVIAMCQFNLDPQTAVIKSIAYAPGCEKDEAVIILVRTVMNFMYRADIPEVSIEPDAADADFIKMLGFREKNGSLKIDLKKFYRSPCHYEAD
jgi:hypothetical protein